MQFSRRAELIEPFYVMEVAKAAQAMARELGLQTVIEVDGGISAHNARLLFDTGADVLVAGNAVFGADDPKAEIERMLDV